MKSGSVLVKNAIDSPPISSSDTAKYRTITGILLHMVRWSRLDCHNDMQEFLQHVNGPKEACMNHLSELCEYIVKTKDRGFTIKPDNPGSWEGTRDSLFIISGKFDSNFAKDPTGQSVRSGCTFLCGAMIKM